MPRRASRLIVETLEDRWTPAAGDLDTSFGSGGIVTLSNQSVGSTAALPDGQFLAVVNPSGATADVVERFNADGTLDTTYGTNGATTLPFTNTTTIQPQLAVLPDGEAVVGGAFTPAAGGADFELARLTAAGALDTTFGTGGTASVPISAAQASTGVLSTAIAAEPANDDLDLGGRIVVVVSTMTQTIVTELTTDGVPLQNFGTNGEAILTFPSGQTTNPLEGVGVALMPDARVVLTGSAGSNPAAARLTELGQLDTTFGTGGLVQIALPQSGATFTGTPAVKLLANGDVMFAGQLRIPQVSDSGLAVRLTPAGQLDTTYGSGGFATTQSQLENANDVFVTYTYSAAIDPVGRAVFSSTGLVVSKRIYLAPQISRLTEVGSVDSQFGTNGVANPLPNSASPSVPQGSTLPDGNILLVSGDSIVQLLGYTPPAGFVAATTGTLPVGGAADGTFQVLNPTDGTYSAAGTTTAFPGSSASARVTMADVNGDGTPDYIVGAGPGAAPEVSVYDGKTGALLADFLAFEPTFTGGVFVAATARDASGAAEIFVTPDQGGGPRVVIFSLSDGSTTQVASFYGIDDPSFRGGARLAVGDLNGDGVPDLVVAAGYLGGPRVAVYDGTTLLRPVDPLHLIPDFYAFPGADATNLRDGVYVAIGDLTGSGTPDLIFGAGPGGAPRVLVLSWPAIMAGGVGSPSDPVANFFVAGDSADRGGVRVATTNASGSGADDLVVGSGQGDPGSVRVYTGTYTTPGEPTDVQAVPVFGGATLADGVYVG